MTFLELGVACGCTPRGLWAGDLHAGSTGRADPEPRGTALAPRQSREAVAQPDHRTSRRRAGAHTGKNALKARLPLLNSILKLQLEGTEPSNNGPLKLHASISATGLNKPPSTRSRPKHVLSASQVPVPTLCEDSTHRQPHAREVWACGRECPRTARASPKASAEDPLAAA